MTARPWRAARRGAVAFALAALLAGCGGSGGDGGADRSAQSSTRKNASVSHPAGSTTPSATSPGTATPQPGVLRSLAAWAGAPDPGGAGHRDGQGSAARFSQPTAVAAVSDGSYWVIEADRTRVRRVDAEGAVTTLFDARTDRLSFDVAGRQVHLTRPHALAAAPSGGAIFGAMQEPRLNPDGSTADGGLLAVVRVVPGAPVQLVVLPDVAQGISGAAAMALDSQGRLYIAAGCSIWRTDGDVIAATGPRQLQQVYPPAESGCNSITKAVHRLAVDAEGRVVFTLSLGEVMRLEPDLRVTTLGRTSAGPGFRCGGMVVDRQGGVLINGEKAVLRLDATTGREQVVAGHAFYGGWLDGSPETARFGSICGLAIDRQGRVVLVDHHNHNLRRGEPDGRVITLAGQATQEGHRDGIAQDALFGPSFWVSAGTGDEVLIGDWWNATVRSVDARQRVSTVVGAPLAEGDRSRVAVDGPVATARLGYGTAASRTPDGSLWIADLTELRRLGPDGIVRRVSASHRDNVWDLGLDPDGDLVVAWGYFGVGLSGPGISGMHFERYSGRNPDVAPEVLHVRLPDDLGRRVAGERLFGLCVLPDRSIAFSQGHAVLRRAADGTVALLAGSPDEHGEADGPALSARFGRPGGLACDSSGGIYAADPDNHTVRYIDAQRNVRTVLGTPGRKGHRFDALPGELNSPSSVALVPGGLIVATGQGLVRAGF